MTPTGTSRIIRSRNSVRVMLACGSPNAMYRVATSSSSFDAFRPRSISAACRPAAATVSRAGATRCRNVRSGDGIPGTRPSGPLSPPAVVAMRTTPATREPNSSGCWPASAMIVMPPIEWPTRITRERSVVTDRMTASRSPAV